MSRYLDPVVYTIIGLLVVGLGFGYWTDRIASGTAVFLGILVVTLAVIVVVFLRRLSHPSETVEQMLYKSDHPTHT